MAKNKPNFENLKVVEENESMATPELQKLFFEWCNQIEDEIREFIKINNTDNMEAIAKHFKLSHESCVYLMNRIKTNGKF